MRYFYFLTFLLPQSNRFDVFCCVSSDTEAKPTKSFLQMFFKKYYGPFLMNDFVRAIVVSAEVLSNFNVVNKK